MMKNCGGIDLLVSKKVGRIPANVTKARGLELCKASPFKYSFRLGGTSLSIFVMRSVGPNMVESPSHRMIKRPTKRSPVKACGYVAASAAAPLTANNNHNTFAEATPNAAIMADLNPYLKEEARTSNTAGPGVKPPTKNKATSASQSSNATGV